MVVKSGGALLTVSEGLFEVIGVVGGGGVLSWSQRMGGWDMACVGLEMAAVRGCSQRKGVQRVDGLFIRVLRFKRWNVRLEAFSADFRRFFRFLNGRTIRRFVFIKLI